MEHLFSVNAYSLALAVGAAHGLLLSVMLLVSTRNRRTSNVLLAMLLLFYTMPVLKVLSLELGPFRSFASWPWTVELLYGLGPSLYLYAKTITDHSYRLRKQDLLHYLPVLLELAYYLTPLYQDPTAYALTAPRSWRHLVWIVEQAGGIVSVVAYLVATNVLLWRYAKWVRDHYSDSHQRALRWLRRPVMLYTVFFVLWFSQRAVDVWWFDDRLATGPYYPLLLFLSASTYWIGTRGYLEAQATTIGFDAARSETAARNETRESSIETPDDDASIEPLFQALTALMAEQRLYRETDLSLTDLAGHLKINPRLLSKVINTRAKMNFYDFVNQYRVAAFKARVGGLAKHRTLLDLAHDCGFGSKATFNAVFKKQTGMTPSQYRKQHGTPPDEA